jgi:hypothetical protein
MEEEMVEELRKEVMQDLWLQHEMEEEEKADIRKQVTEATATGLLRLDWIQRREQAKEMEEEEVEELRKEVMQGYESVLDDKEEKAGRRKQVTEATATGLLRLDWILRRMQAKEMEEEEVEELRKEVMQVLWLPDDGMAIDDEGKAGFRKQVTEATAPGLLRLVRLLQWEQANMMKEEEVEELYKKVMQGCESVMDGRRRQDMRKHVTGATAPELLRLDRMQWWMQAEVMQGDDVFFEFDSFNQL